MLFRLIHYMISLSDMVSQQHLLSQISLSACRPQIAIVTVHKQSCGETCDESESESASHHIQPKPYRKRSSRKVVCSQCDRKQGLLRSNLARQHSQVKQAGHKHSQPVEIRLTQRADYRAYLTLDSSLIVSDQFLLYHSRCWNTSEKTPMTDGPKCSRPFLRFVKSQFRLHLLSYSMS